MRESDRKAMLSAAQEALLAAFPDAWAIYVYGSFATGDERPDSDLDLAVLPAPKGRGWDKLAVISSVAQRVCRDVDVVDLRGASDVLRREVLEHGQQLYASDPDRVLDWEATALTRYGHYREEVRDLLDDFERTGVGYRQ